MQDKWICTQQEERTRMTNFLKDIIKNSGNEYAGVASDGIDGSDGSPWKLVELTDFMDLMEVRGSQWN